MPQYLGPVRWAVDRTLAEGHTPANLAEAVKFLAAKVDELLEIVNYLDREDPD